MSATENDEVVGVRDDMCAECLAASGHPPMPACIQSIGSFVRAATGVVTTWRDLLARIGFFVFGIFVGIRYPFRLDTKLPGQG
ncbi:hypothetical protein V1293_004021 [Bradyrhizobium sp. AZCC 1693]